MFDVLIIGAGVIGCSIARALSKYQLTIGVVEKERDIAERTSKANSGIIHPGEDPIPGSMKAKMNGLGNPMFEQLQQELDFPFRRNGSMVLAFQEQEKEELENLRQRGLENGMPDTMQILTREEALVLEPNLSKGVVAALYLPTGGIICPYEFTLALGENARQNGVQFLLDRTVEKIRKEQDVFQVTTSKEIFTSKILINATGVYAAILNNQISTVKYHITPRKGEYLLLDKKVGNMVNTTLFQLPTKMGKGVLVATTVHGNLLIGPTAKDIEALEDVTTTQEGILEITEKAKQSIVDIPINQLITTFAGIRAHEDKGDFIIGEAEDVGGFINALGIESPGLTSAPAIAGAIEKIVVEKLTPPLNLSYTPIRKAIRSFRESTTEERKALIAKNSTYGKIVCRCEMVTEAEIIEAMNRSFGMPTVDSIKKRTRAGMGRCQGGFCISSVIEEIAANENIPLEAVRKNREDSYLLVGDIKSLLEEEEAYV